MLDIPIETITELLIPLLIILICGFVGYFFSKAIGFLAGINVGVIVVVLALDFPVYSLIAVVIVDILLIFGVDR